MSRIKFKTILYLTSRKDGRVGGSWAHFVPQLLLDTTHISVNNPNNYSKSGRTDSIAKCREESTSMRVGRTEMNLGAKWNHRTVCESEGCLVHGQGREELTSHKILQAQGTHTRKTNAQNIWLWKPKGFNFTSSPNHWDLTYGTLKSVGSALGQLEGKGNWIPVLKRQYNKQPHWDTHKISSKNS